MSYKRDLWEIAGPNHGVLTVAEAEEADVPAVEVRKLAARGVLVRQGQGIYIHRDVPPTSLQQPAVAVALGGHGAFLERESVFDLLGLGQFNPKKIRVGTHRRRRKKLPEWMTLERRTDVSVNEIATYHGIPATTIRRALIDMHCRMPRERWTALLGEVVTKDLLKDTTANKLVKELA